MPPSESQKRASLKWDKENMIVLGCKVKRTQAIAFKSYCEERGKTSNTVLKEYVLDCIGRQSATGSPIQGVDGILSADTLKAAQEAAKAAGEAVSQFLNRAVTIQAQRDALVRKMEGGEQGGD